MKYTIEEATKIAHNRWDEAMFCPGCGGRRLLTGLHMMSECYAKFIQKEAKRIVRECQKS